MNLLVYACAVLLCAAGFCLAEAAWLWWSGSHGSAARRIARRLRVMDGHGDGVSGLSILKQRRYSAAPWLDAQLRRLAPAARLDRALLQAGLRCSVAQFLGRALLGLALALGLAAAVPMPGGAVAALLGAALALPYLLLRRLRGARLAKIERQLPEAADFLARALRAGHSFSNVLQMVGEEMPEPLGAEFRIAYEEINYGVPMPEALQNLAARIPLADLRYLVVAVLIQRESGGNLAEILISISRIIRARLTLLGQVRVLSAEGKMSAWVLGALPLVLLGLMALISPAYVGVLWRDPLGVRMLWYGAGMIGAGVLWMRQTIRIRV